MPAQQNNAPKDAESRGLGTTTIGCNVQRGQTPAAQRGLGTSK